MSSIFTKFASEIWRAYETAGVPSSGAHVPIKADMVAWGTQVEGGVDTAQAAAVAAVSADISRLEIARRSALFTTAI